MRFVFGEIRIIIVSLIIGRCEREKKEGGNKAIRSFF